MRAGIVLATVLAGILALGSATAQQRHWLLGTWEGRLEGLPKLGRAGPERTLVVKNVAPNGAMGRADLLVAGKPVSLVVTIVGEQVSFFTPGVNGITHELSHRSGRLEGTWTIRGSNKSGPMWLKRK